jgi:type IV pilus assembly protein PilW
MTASKHKQVTGQLGFTIIELMIAMVIGLLLTGGVIQIFTSVSATNRVHEDTARMQENGRMALEVMGRDIRMADFWGCAASGSNVTNNLDPLGAGYVDYVAGGIDGTEGGAGPDTLVLRGGVDAGLAVEPPFGPQASAVVKVPGGTGLSQSDIVFVSDCSAADIFQITNSNPDSSGQLVHNTGATTAPGNYNATNPGCPGVNAHCLSKIYGSDATVFRTQEIIYTIGVGSEGEPALFRNGEEFLDGVEDLQILYGEDTDAPGTAGSGIADYYVPADQVVDMTQVISIRIAVVTRSYNERLTGGLQQSYTVLGANRTAADERLRQVYTATVAVRNRI